MRQPQHLPLACPTKRVLCAWGFRAALGSRWVCHFLQLQHLVLLFPLSEAVPASGAGGGFRKTQQSTSALPCSSARSGSSRALIDTKPGDKRWWQQGFDKQSDGRVGGTLLSTSPSAARARGSRCSTEWGRAGGRWLCAQTPVRFVRGFLGVYGDVFLLCFALVFRADDFFSLPPALSGDVVCNHPAVSSPFCPPSSVAL